MTYRNNAARLAVVLALAAPLVSAANGASGGRKDPVLTARHLNRGASLKVFNATGAVRIVGWSHDSLEVRGNVSPRSRYYGYADSIGGKIGMEETRPGEPPTHGDLTLFVPRGTQLSVKTVNGNIDATDVSGWFYTVAGAVRVGGTAKTIEIDAMRGDIDLDVSVPWLHARAGAGHVVVRGAVEDADITTIDGALDLMSSGIMRGQFASVSGDIRWAGAPARGAILDFSNHSGAVEFTLPRSTIGTFALSTVSGTIANGFAQVRPVAQADRSVRVTFGRGGADVTVRTFKGAIRMRPE
jgi:DUF4097 and DUF4098 domain-containing protein YvlB